MNTPISYTPSRILRLPEVIERTGLSRSEIYRQMADRAFPRSIRLTQRGVGWLEHEVEDWILRRVRVTRCEATA